MEFQDPLAESIVMRIINLVCLLMLVSACAPGKEDSQASALSGLQKTWDNSSETLSFNPTNSFSGKVIVSFATGGACMYDYTETWSDPNGHDTNAGSIVFSSGQVSTPWAGLTNASCYDQQWDYAFLASDSLILCGTNGCLNLFH